jgi:hypothetical protein
VTALTTVSLVPPLTISLLFKESRFPSLWQVRNSSSAHTLPPLTVTASDCPPTLRWKACLAGFSHRQVILGGQRHTAFQEPQPEGRGKKKGFMCLFSTGWCILWPQSGRCHVGQANHHPMDDCLHPPPIVILCLSITIIIPQSP